MKKKLLFVTETLGSGGAEKLLVDLLRHLDKGRFEVTVCSVWDIGGYRETVRELADHYVPLLPDMKLLHGFRHWLMRKKRRLIFRRPASWAYRFLLPKGHDVEIAWLEGITTRLVAGSCNKKAKKYAWIHCNLEELPLLDRCIKGRKAQRKALSCFDAVVGVSRAAADAVKRLYGLAQVKTIYNPVDTDYIRSQARAALIGLPEKRADYRLVSVARLLPQKGGLRLLHAIKGLRDGGLSVELWLLGEGEEREACEAYIREHHLHEWVTLWGFQGNPYPYIRQSDLYVCASLSEGWGLSMAEALIIGTPVVSTCRFEREDDGRTPYCVITENSEDGLCRGIGSCCAPPGSWRLCAASWQMRPTVLVP